MKPHYARGMASARAKSIALNICADEVTFCRALGYAAWVSLIGNEQQQHDPAKKDSTSDVVP